MIEYDINRLKDLPEMARIHGEAGVSEVSVAIHDLFVYVGSQRTPARQAAVSAGISAIEAARDYLRHGEHFARSVEDFVAKIKKAQQAEAEAPAASANKEAQ